MLFTILCAAVAIERLLELRWSQRHARIERRRGGEIVREPAFALMAFLHTAVLFAAPIEMWFRRTPPPVWLVVVAALMLAGATALRIWSLRTLGAAWSVRVTRYPEDARPVITSGPYHYIRHPNYVAVIVELIALPLVGGAWVTAVVASVVNAIVLMRRIPLEEQELGRSAEWRRAMLPKPRFLPRRL